MPGTVTRDNFRTLDTFLEIEFGHALSIVLATGLHTLHESDLGLAVGIDISFAIRCGFACRDIRRVRVRSFGYVDIGRK